MYTEEDHIGASVPAERREAVSILQMKLQGEHRHRPAVAIVRRVVDKLIVETEMRPAEQTDTVESFDYLLRPCIGQSAVADDAAEPAGGEIKLALMRDSIDRAGQPEGVVRPAPALGQRGQKRRNRERSAERS